MEPIVKYHFDREMVAFVKTLELKPAMFGYEKNDVFNKFKDLLVKARDVCEELVAAEHRKLEELKEAVTRAKDDPEALTALLAGWESAAEDQPEDEAAATDDQPDILPVDSQEDSFHAALSEQLDSETAAGDSPEIARLQEENARLRTELAEYAALTRDLDTEVDTENPELEALRQENTRLRTELAACTARVEELEARVEAGDPELVRLKEENTALQAEVAGYAALVEAMDAVTETAEEDPELVRLREEVTSLQAEVTEYAALVESMDAITEPTEEDPELVRLREENSALQNELAEYVALLDEVDAVTEPAGEKSDELVRLGEENEALRIQLAEYAVLIEELDHKASPEVPGGTALTELREENESLKARLAAYAEREELLQKAHAIVTEARLEKEQIVRSAQVDAEQELFLYRAKRRDEEEAFMKELADLEKRKKELTEAKARYEDLVKEGDQLFDQMKAYGERLESARIERQADELDGVPFDPPQLTVDEVHGCTEEAMPLCEIAEEDPESIFAEPDYSSEPEDNEPAPESDESGCQNNG